MTGVILESSFVELLINFCIASSALLAAMWCIDRIFRDIFPDLIELAWKFAIVAVFIAVIPWSFRPNSALELDEPWLKERSAAIVQQVATVFDDLFSSAPAPKIVDMSASRRVTSANGADAPAPAVSAASSPYLANKAGAQLPSVKIAPPTSTAIVAKASLPTAPQISVSDGVKIVWAAVCILFFIKVFIEYRLAIRQFGVRRPLARNHKAYRFVQEFYDCGAIKFKVNLTVSDEIMSPVSLIGNEICLPRWTVSECSDQQLKSLLAHETGHLHRNDPLVFILLHALEKLFFFQPLFRIAHARLRVLAEIAADEWAVRHTEDAREIARALYTCAHKIKSKQQPQWGLAMANNQSILKQRVERLLLSKKRVGVYSAGLFKLSVMLLLLAGMFLVPQLQFAEARNSGASTSYVIDDDGVNTVRVRKEDHEIDAEWLGRVTFSPDESSIVDVSEDGYFKLLTDDGTIEREIAINPGNGGLQTLYKVNGDDASFDEAGQIWLAENIRFLVRNTGMFAEERVERILAEGGVDAVVTELAHIESDFVRKLYITATLNQRDVTADELLALKPAIKSMESDFETRSVLIAMLDTQNVDASFLPHFLDIAGSIESDFELRTVLVRLTEFGPASEASQQAFLTLTESIESDFELREAITSAMENDFFGSEGIGRALEIAGQSIDSDFELRTVITYAATSMGDNPQATKAAIAALPSIESDFELRTAITAIVEHGLLDQADWVAVIGAIKYIDSDFEAATSLASVAKNMPREDDILAAYENAMRKLENQHEYVRAQRALAGEDLSRETMVAPSAPVDSVRPTIARRAEAVRVRNEVTRVRAADLMDAEQRVLVEERAVLQLDRERLEQDREGLEREAAAMREQLAVLERELERMKLEDETGDDGL